MALLQCDFFSETLALSCSMNVILPQATQRQIGMAQAAPAAGHRRGADRGYPTLYLLHGLSDDHTTWVRRTSIERYAAGLGLAVVMPAVHRSFYTDTAAAGHRYFDFISEELPPIAREFFPLSAARQDNFIAGLSMGGYGAFKLALTHPDRFAAAASLSGALDVAARFAAAGQGPMPAREWRAVFGELDSIPGSANDLFTLARRLAEQGSPPPALYQCCGDADPLLEDNRRFRDHLRALGIDATYHEDPGRAHDWAYWDEAIQRVLAWLPLPGRG